MNKNLEDCICITDYKHVCVTGKSPSDCVVKISKGIKKTLIPSAIGSDIDFRWCEDENENTVCEASFFVEV